MADHHSALVTPANTSEFYAMYRAIVAHHHANHDATMVIATQLRKALPKATGGRLPTWARPDLAYNARRVTKHLTQAAAAELAAAAAHRQAYVTYLQLFTSNGSGGAKHAGAFNVDQ